MVKARTLYKEVLSGFKGGNTREIRRKTNADNTLLSNNLLDHLDREMEKRNLRFARYADDVIILVKDQGTGE